MKRRMVLVTSLIVVRKDPTETMLRRKGLTHKSLLPTVERRHGEGFMRVELGLWLLTVIGSGSRELMSELDAGITVRAGIHRPASSSWVPPLHLRNLPRHCLRLETCVPTHETWGHDRHFPFECRKSKYFNWAVSART